MISWILFSQGGVTSCGGSIVKDFYQIQESRNSTCITLSLCGNPKPLLRYTWAEEDNGLARINPDFVDEKARKYQYEIDLHNVSRKHCGTEIHFNASGLITWKASSKLMVKCELIISNCNLRSDRDYFLSTTLKLSKRWAKIDNPTLFAIPFS